MRTLFRAFSVMAFTLFMASCHKTAKTVVTPTNNATISSEMVERINANRNTAEQVTGRMSMDLEAGKQKLSVGGNIKMKRNDVIQLSLQVFGFVEAGRLELTKDYILILNRIGKQYVKVNYKDVPFFRENGINFYTFQSLLWNELFVPGLNDALPTTTEFIQTKNGEDIILTNTTKQIVTKFLTNATTGMLTQTSISPDNQASLIWKYNSWARLNTKDFPDKMHLSINVKNTGVNATLQFSRLRTDEKWKDTRTVIDSKKLKQVNIQQAFSQILSLSN